MAGSWSFFVWFCLLLHTFPYFSLNFSSVLGREFTLCKVYSYIQRHIMPCCAKLVWCCLNLNLMPCPAVQVPEKFYVCVFASVFLSTGGATGETLSMLYMEGVFSLFVFVFYATLPGSFFCATLKNVCFVSTLFPGLLLVFTNTLPPRYSLPPTSAPCFVFPFSFWCWELWRYSLNK